MKNNIKNTEKVTVIGMGSMGTTLARLLLQKGYHVTVWNRTTAKAEQIVKEGAVMAETVEDAVRSSQVIVICVHNYKTSENILSKEAVTSALTGKILLQLTTGSPKEAKDSEAWAESYGAKYLDGAIQAAPSQMGRPDTPIFVSGSKEAFNMCEQVLKVFAGGLTYLGTSVEAAAAMDLATLSYIYGASLGFFHGARIAEVSGINVETYGSLVAGISQTFGDFLKHESTVIHSGDFIISESPLRISVEATERILQQSREAGINDEFPAFAARIFRKAADAGYGNEEVAAIIKLLRKEPTLFNEKADIGQD